MQANKAYFGMNMRDFGVLDEVNLFLFLLFSF